MPTNPIVAQVAKRLYQFVCADMIDDFATLTATQKEGWYIEAGKLLEPVADAAAAAWTRTGFDADADSLEEVTASAADRVAGRYRRTRTEWRNSLAEEMPSDAFGALAALAALRAALGYSPKPTAPEVVESMADHERQTPDGDLLRLHIAAAHGHVVVLGAGDGEAGQIHRWFHAAGRALYSHHVTNREWSNDEVQAAIVAAATDGVTRAQFDRPYQEHLKRTPKTVDHDPLRLHLLSVHCLVNAMDLHDHEVLDAHDHEHTGPGTIRNHPRGDLTWTVDKIHRVLDDLRDDPDEQRRVTAAVEEAVARVQGVAT